MIHKTDFMCIHSDEAKQRALDCYERVCKEVSRSGSKEDFLTGIVFALQLIDEEEHSDRDHYYARIRGIDSDQWCGVSVDVTNGRDLVGTVFVQCDIVEHGIARAYELAKEVIKEAEEKELTNS